MGKTSLVIDCRDRACFLKEVSSLEEAAECIVRYRKLAWFEPDIAARSLEGTGFSPVRIEDLPPWNILYCCLREGGEREGIYEDMSASLLVGDGKDMPCTPTWSIDGFVEMYLPRKRCQDPTCEGGLGDGCSC